MLRVFLTKNIEFKIHDKCLFHVVLHISLANIHSRETKQNWVKSVGWFTLHLTVCPIVSMSTRVFQYIYYLRGQKNLNLLIRRHNPKRINIEMQGGGSLA